MTRRTLLLCVVAGLVVVAGCAGGDTEAPTPADASTPTPTPGYPIEVITPSSNATYTQARPATATPTPTSTPIPTPSPTPTPAVTPSPTPTPTATPSDTPEVESGYVREWVETTHSNTTVRVRVHYTRVKETIETRDGEVSAAGDNRFVVAKVDIANRPGRVDVGRSQWTFVDWRGQSHSHDGVTDDLENPFPEEEEIVNGHAEGKIVWEVEYYEKDREFEAEPYGDQSGRTVRIVDD